MRKEAKGKKQNRTEIYRILPFVGRASAVRAEEQDRPRPRAEVHGLEGHRLCRASCDVFPQDPHS